MNGIAGPVALASAAGSGGLIISCQMKATTIAFGSFVIAAAECDCLRVLCIFFPSYARLEWLSLSLLKASECTPSVFGPLSPIQVGFLA